MPKIRYELKSLSEFAQKTLKNLKLIREPSRKFGSTYTSHEYWRIMGVDNLEVGRIYNNEIVIDDKSAEKDLVDLATQYEDKYSTTTEPITINIVCSYQKDS